MFENFGKRAIKFPKIYFNDTGLLGIDSEKIIERDPFIGNIFENLVLLEIMKVRLNKGLNPNICFFRNTNGLEVDILFKEGSKLIPIEIKSSATFNKIFSKNIHKFQKLTSNAQKGYVFYSGEFKAETKTYKILNHLQIHSLFDREN